MKEDEIEELMSGFSTSVTPDDGFKSHLLAESTCVLNRHIGIRRRTRFVGMLAMLMAVAVGAFLCGQHAEQQQIVKQPGQIRTTMPDGEKVLVSSEVVDWLGAAKFFTQLGMDERADKAYRRASGLLENSNAEVRQTDCSGYDRILASSVSVK